MRTGPSASGDQPPSKGQPAGADGRASRAVDVGASPVGGRNETTLERLDRNLLELMGEVRVVITGIQVLFGFLLVVPFDPGFAHIGAFERTVYFVTLLLTALAAVCTIAPSAHHRVLFRLDDKQHIVLTANRLVLAGLALLAMAMCGSVLLVATKLFGLAAGVGTVTFAALAFVTFWFVLPLRRRRRQRRPPCA